MFHNERLLHITSFFDVTMRLLFICQSICFNSTLEYVNDISNHVFCENEILIYIGKKKRIFFMENDSIHSMYFPFSLNDDCELISNIFNIDLHNVIGIVISALQQMPDGDKNATERIEAIENYFQDNYLDISGETFNNCIKLLNYLFNFDCGYLRYDYDLSGRVGHPLNHLDIFFDDSVGVKIELSCGNKIDILDLVKICNIFDDGIDVKYVLQQKQ